MVGLANADGTVISVGASVKEHGTAIFPEGWGKELGIRISQAVSENERGTAISQEDLESAHGIVVSQVTEI